MTVTARHRTYPKSVKPGIPKLGKLKSGWTRVPIGDLFDVVQRPVKMRDDVKYDLVTVKRSRGGIARRSTLQGYKISVKSQFELRADDFLISKRQIVHGACAVVDEEFSGSIVSNEYSVLRCRDELHLPFLKYMTHTPYFQRTCFHSSIGVHVEKMIFKLDDWFHWKIDIPTLPEQEKIAGFLGAVDGKLGILRDKHKGLERFKRGLMQKLFSRTLRFTRPDGTPYPDWEEKRLGHAVELKAGKFVTASQICETKNRDLYPCYGGNGLRGYVETYTHSGTLPLIGRQGAHCGNIKLATGRFHATEHAVVANPRSGVTALWLFFKLLAMNLNKYSTGLAQPGLSVDNLNRLPIHIPHPEEQQKIADALSALDAKITAVSDQITRLENFKRGLLQKMFV